MTDKRSEHDPHKADASKNPARQTGEEHGRIKRPQRTDATMDEDDLPRGSEPEQLGAARRRP